MQQLCHSGLVRHRSPVVALAWGQVEHRRMQLASSDASGEVGFLLTRLVIDFFFFCRLYPGMWCQGKFPSKWETETNLLEGLPGWLVPPLASTVEMLLCFWHSTHLTIWYSGTWILGRKCGRNPMEMHFLGLVWILSQLAVLFSGVRPPFCLSVTFIHQSALKVKGRSFMWHLAVGEALAGRGNRSRSGQARWETDRWSEPQPFFLL